MSPSMINPPKKYQRMMSRLIPSHIGKSGLGDFDELYGAQVARVGKKKANRWYRKQLVYALSAYLIETSGWFVRITKNSFKTTFRRLSKSPGLTIINVSGLTIGILCFLLVGIYYQHETSYDRFHKNSHRIYRITSETRSSQSIKHSVLTPGPLASSLKMDYSPLIEETVRFWNYWGLGFNVQYKDKVFNEIRFTYVDPSIFSVFDFEFVIGDSENALNAPFEVVITESMADKYFGWSDPIGQQLRINDGYNLTVVAVVRDLPVNSHFHFGFLASLSSLEQMPWRRSMEGWGEFCVTYAMLKAEVSPIELEMQWAQFKSKYLPADSRERIHWHLQNIEEIHLKSHMENEFEHNSQVSHIQLLLIIGSFILIISIINYVNLTTAHSSLRIKEIGVRKIMGSQRSQLIAQFMGEACLTVTSAVLLSLILLPGILPYFLNFIQKEMEPSLLFSIDLWIFYILVGLIVTVLAGSYPAFTLSSLPVGNLFSNTSGFDMRKSGPRKILVIFQISLAAILIICALTVQKQVRFIQNFDTHFSKDQIVILRTNMTPIAHGNYETFVDEITKCHGIQSATGMRTITGFNHLKEGFSTSGGPFEMIPFFLVRHDFSQTFGMEVLTGRDFSRDYATDSDDAILVNEAFIQQMGWSLDEAVGQPIHHQGWGQLKTIGVVKNFNFESLHSSISPLVIKLIWPRRHEPLTDYIAVRLDPEEPEPYLTVIEQIWKKFAPNSAFDYFFLDDKIETFYASEIVVRNLTALFVPLAIFISCLGLLGLVSFLVVQRSKEFAVRKVFGAQPIRLFQLVVKEFAFLNLYSLIIAWPISFIVASRWLTNFSYRTQTTVNHFIFSFILLGLTSMIAILFHTVNAIRQNPVERLRHE